MQNQINQSIKIVSMFFLYAITIGLIDVIFCGFLALISQMPFLPIMQSVPMIMLSSLTYVVSIIVGLHELFNNIK